MSRHAFAVLGIALLFLVGCTSAQSSPDATISAQPSAAAPSATSPAASPSPSPSEEGQLYAPLGYKGEGTIAFVRYDPSIDDNGAYLIKPDGSDETRLRVTTNFAGEPADFNGFGCCPVLSPDGHQVAIAYDDWSGLFGDSGIRKTQILHLDGSRVTQIPRVCGGCGSIQGVDIVARAWSLDGSVVAVSLDSEEDHARNGMGLAQMDGPGLWTPVTAGHDDFPITFSPDSRRVIFLRADEGDGALMQGTRRESPNSMFLARHMTVHQVSPRGWRVVQDDYIGPAASYSPDGSQIAFVADDQSGDGPRLYVVDADGGKPQSIAGPAAVMTTAAWSPDGKWIAFDGSVNGGPHDVYAVHPDGSGQMDLSKDLGLGACCMHWSPDSKALLVQATATDDNHAELFIVQLDGDRFFQVTTQPALYENVSWGPPPQ